MKVTLELDIAIDGRNPGLELILTALAQQFPGYIGSEQIDETDEWGIEINGVKLVNTNQNT